MTDTLKAKANIAYERAATWLYEANLAIDAGNTSRQDMCERKATYWFDRYNKLTGQISEMGMTSEQRAAFAVSDLAFETSKDDTITSDNKPGARFYVKHPGWGGGGAVNLKG